MVYCESIFLKFNWALVLSAQESRANLSISRRLDVVWVYKCVSLMNAVTKKAMSRYDLQIVHSLTALRILFKSSASKKRFLCTRNSGFSLEFAVKTFSRFHKTNVFHIFIFRKKVLKNLSWVFVQSNLWLWAWGKIIQHCKEILVVPAEPRQYLDMLLGTSIHKQI